jgi:hypothetical protein
MIGILCISIASSIIMTVLLKIFGNDRSQKLVSGKGSEPGSADEFQDGAARREVHQRGFGRMWWNKST